MPKLSFVSLLGRRSSANRLPGNKRSPMPGNGRKTSSRRKMTFELQTDCRSFHHLSSCSVSDLAAMQRICVEALTTLRRIDCS